MACATLKRSLELDPLCSRPSKRRRYNPMTPTVPTKEEEPSPFAEVTPALTMDHISISIRQEMKRMHRRKKLHYNNYKADSGSGSSDREGSRSPTNNGPPSPSNSDDTPASPTSLSLRRHHHCKDKQLFTFRQVGMICERLLKEREDSLRETYDELLNAKLVEQYDTFVKFTYDQIQKWFENSAAPSYLS